MNLKTQLLIATLIVLGGCPIPPITDTTKDTVPDDTTSDTTGDDDDDDDTDTGG